MKFILILSLLIPSVCEANIFQVRELYLVHKKFGEGSRNPLIDDNGLENRELGNYK